MVFFESKFKYNEKQVLYLTNSIEIINGFVDCENFFLGSLIALLLEILQIKRY